MAKSKGRRLAEWLRNLDSNSKATKDTIANSSIDSTKLEDDAVTNPKIADGAVHTANIADTGVTFAKLHTALVVTESDGIGNNDNDTTIATSAAIKDYVDTAVAGKDNTDEITEGSTNLYFTNERVDDRVNSLLTAGTGITLTYDDAANTLTVAGAAQYGDSDVDSHLNQSTASNGEYLKWNGSDYEWATVPAGYTDSDVGSYLSTNGYATQSTIVAAITDSAPATLDTLNELAAALGDDANFSTTTATSLGNRLRVDTAAQGLTSTQQANAITNLGITATVAELNYVDGVTSNIQTQLNAKGTSNFSGSYNDLTNKPTIPTNNNQLTNGAGYITSFDITTQTDSKYLRSNAADTATGTITISGLDQSLISQYNVSGNFWSGRIISSNTTTGVASFLGNYNGYAGVFAHNSALSAWAPIYINTLSTGNGAANVYLGTTYINGNTAWHAGNDGSGSGLDADTLDGSHASSFMLSSGMPNNTDVYMNFRVMRNSNTTTSNDGMYIGYANSNSGPTRIYGGGSSTAHLYISGTSLTFNGSNIWHAGNDGSGSGLDADNLDGSTWSTQTKGVAWRQGTTEAGNDNGIGFWGNTSGAAGSYAIYMSAAGGTYAGRVTGDAGNSDYNMYFKMAGGTNRGFVFKNSGTNVAGIDASGKLTLTGSIYSSGTLTTAATSHTMTTPHGYIQIGPMNTSYAHIYTDRGSFYFNKDTLYANGNLMWTAANDGSGSGLDADLLDGLQLHTGRNNEANKVVRTDASGYIQAGWINTPSGNAGIASNITKFYCSYDDYVRYLDRNEFKVQLGGTYHWNADRRDYTTDSSYWNGAMGWGTTDLNSVFNWGVGFWDSWSTPANNPGGSSHFTGINVGHYANGGTRYGWQMTMAAGDVNNFYVRGTWSSFGSWAKIWNSSNDGSGSGLDADTLDGSGWQDYGRDIHCNQIIADDWLRTTGATGWYNNTYQGGWYMTDTTWIRTYNNKSIYQNAGTMRTDGTLQVGSSGATFQAINGGAVTISGNTAWHAGNDGAGSGLDADNLDGYTWGTAGKPAFVSAGNTAAFTSANDTTVSIRSSGTSTAASMSFHRPGAYAINFGLDTDNHLKMGGWSLGAVTPHIWQNNGTYLATGDIYAYYSDERLKTKHGKIENAIEKVNSIETFYYTHNEKAKELGFEDDERMHVGVSAQSVEKVMPEVVALAPVDNNGSGVSITGEDYKTVQYEKLVPLLIEAIKEQQAQIEKLKEKLK